MSAARLTAAAGKETVTDSRSLVTSPVVLAVRPELHKALGDQKWSTLPDLQTKPDSLAGLKLPAWGSLRLALPLGGNSDAAYLAGEAVAAASVPPGAPPTDGNGAVRTLIGGQPKLADNSLGEAMNALLKTGDAATAPVHAVVTTEQQLFARGQSESDAGSTLSSWLPPGAAAVADYPTVLLSGSWLSQEQVTAASEFARFMHKPDQLAELAKAGFRAEGTKPPKSDVTDFPALPSTLSVGDDGDARRAGQHRVGAGERAGGDDHARAVDDHRRRRQDPAGQCGQRSRRPDQGAGAQRGDRTVDLRRQGGPLRGAGGPAGRSGRRQAAF